MLLKNLISNNKLLNKLNEVQHLNIVECKYKVSENKKFSTKVNVP